MYEFNFNTYYLGTCYMDSEIGDNINLAQAEIFKGITGESLVEGNLDSTIQITDYDLLDNYTTRYYLEVADIYNDGYYSGTYVVDVIHESAY